MLVYKADYEECCECYTLHRLKVHEYEFFVQYHEYTLIENIKKTIRLHGVLLRIEKQKAVESNKEKDMKEFSLDAISSPFNKLQLLSENSINANDTMRKEMEFHVYFASQYC